MAEIVKTFSEEQEALETSRRRHDRSEALARLTRQSDNAYWELLRRIKGEYDAMPEPRSFKPPVVMDLTNVRKITPPDWLVEGILPERGLAFVYGSENTGKSFYVLDLAMSIATGEPHLHFETKKGAVAYITAEGVGSFGNRMTAYMQEKQPSHRWMTAPLYLIPQPINLHTAEGRAQLMLAFENMCPDRPSLVVIDTFHACMPGVDENSAKDIGSFIETVSWIREQIGAAVLVVHHSKKSGSEYRGHSAIAGACDMMMHVRIKRTPPAKAVLNLTCRKMKDASFFSPFDAELKVVNLPAGGTSCIVVPLISVASMVTSALGFLNKPMRYTDWESVAKMGGVMTPKTFNRARQTLLDEGRVSYDPLSKLYTRADNKNTLLPSEGTLGSGSKPSETVTSRDPPPRGVGKEVTFQGGTDQMTGDGDGRD